MLPAGSAEATRPNAATTSATEQRSLCMWPPGQCTHALAWLHQPAPGGQTSGIIYENRCSVIELGLQDPGLDADLRQVSCVRRVELLVIDLGLGVVHGVARRHERQLRSEE